jgi:hypothetical protein
MVASEKQLGIFYLEKGQASFFSPTLLAGLSIKIPVNVVNDMEIIDKETLLLLVKNLLTSSRVVCGQILIILSADFTFEGGFAQESLEERAEKLKTFQELVPFENVETRVIRQEKKWRVIVINKDFVDGFKEIFSKLSISVLGVGLFVLLKESFPELAQGFRAKTIFDKIETVKSSCLIESEPKPVPELQSETPKKNSNLKILLIIFGVLLLILLILILSNISR